MSSSNDHQVVGAINGFDTYREYADQLASERRRRYLDANNNDQNQMFKSKEFVVFLDISTDGVVSEPVKLTEHVWLANGHEEKLSSALAFRQKLRQHDVSLRTRLVLAKSHDNKVLQDCFGLEYGLDSDFFTETDPSLRRKTSFVQCSGRWRASVLKRTCKNCNSHDLNIVILVFKDWWWYTAPSLEAWRETLALFPKLSDHYEADDFCAFPNYTTVQLRPSLCTIYCDMLRHEWSQSAVKASNDHPVCFLCPVVDWRSAWVYVQARVALDAEEITESWEKFTIEIHQMEDDVAALWRFAQQLSPGIFLDRFTIIDPNYFKEELSRLASRLKSVYDLQIAEATLRESRNAVRQSELAMEEGKRMKLVTVLAFFFIPLSLATSIFGMNIMELNDQGQPIWIFILTSVLVLLLTVCVWAGFYQWTLFVNAPYDVQAAATDTNMLLAKMEKQDDKYLGRNFGYGPDRIRRRAGLRIIVLLLRHGHFLFLWRSGIAYSLLTSGRRGFRPSCVRESDCRAANVRERLPYYTGFCANPHAPFRYVMVHLEALREISEERRQQCVDPFTGIPINLAQGDLRKTKGEQQSHEKIDRIVRLVP